MRQHCTTAVRQRQNLNATRCWTFFSGLISVFVFGILRFPSGCIQNCCGCITPTCTPLARGLVTGCYRSEDGIVQSLHYLTGFHGNSYSTPTEVLQSFFDLRLAPKQYCTKSYDIDIYIYIYTFRVSQEKCARLRESVPYVKVYRYNPKHLYPKLNGYGDNGQRSLKLWQLLHTYWLPNTY